MSISNTTASDELPSVRAAGVQSSLALLARVLLSLIFILSGFSKIADPAGTIAYIQMVGLPFPALAYAGAVVTEVIGGIALLVGFQTRLVALGVAGFSLVTALVFHSQLSDLNQFIHFFKNVAMTGGLLQIAAFGAGAFSVDSRLGER
ncbi:DoxX family protein [Sinorhizobium medicae]|uniref:Inner membrane protein YqjF n=1 Tax=Sinorhizobium medicae TaxID=110321 RepID=A0A508X794_9HYPH|nr:DoxX family protein [Sinorhizobium medicae]VTZ65440.1 Inner membrane protein YqjF [Sinorhizobium medicae]